MKNIFSSHTIYKVAAVMFALSLWFWVSFQANPYDERVFLVPVVYENLSQELIIDVEKTTFVNVRVEGIAKNLDLLSSKDIHASVDLSLAKIGMNNLPVQVKAPENIKIVQVNPEDIQIDVAEIQEKQMPVSYKINGTPHEGYNYTDPMISPSEIILEGSAETLAQVAQVRVDILLNGDTHYEKSLPLIVLNSKGESINQWLRITPENVDVTLPIFELGMQVKKPVYVPLQGKPAEGYKVVDMQINPEFVTLSESFMDVVDIPYFATAPVNINGKSATFTSTVSVINENRLLTVKPEKIQVVVKIEKE